MRTENKGRSASPHRIIYKSDFHAIKCSFDSGSSLQAGTKTTAAAIQRSATHPNKLLPSLPDSMSHSSTSKVRLQSTRGTKIRDNIFLQMDSQQSRQDCVPAGSSSGSTPLLPPPNPSVKLQTSPFSGSRRSVITPSTAMSALTSISTPGTFQQDKPSKAEEMANIDRVALAQKFSVTRSLFETKMTEVGGGGGLVSKPVIGRGNKENGDGAVSESIKYPEEHGFNQEKSINQIVNISSLKPLAVASLTTCPKPSGPNGFGEAPNKSPSNHGKCDKTADNQTEEDGREKATLDPCLTPQDTLRAELVTIKTESSESDENEEERVRKEDKRCLKGAIKSQAGETEEALVDDVFEEPVVEMTTSGHLNILGMNMEFRESADGAITSSVRQKKLLEAMRWERAPEDGGKDRKDKYQQVNEQWEGKKEEQNRQFTAQVRKNSVEEIDNRETSTVSGLRESVAGMGKVMMQERSVDEVTEANVEKESGQEESRQSRGKGENEGKRVKERTTSELKDELIAEEVKHVAYSSSSDGTNDVGEDKEDQEGVTVIYGLENKAFICDHSHPELSESQRQEEESSLHSESQLIMEYEEIPGVPGLDGQEDMDESEVARRKVRFSMAPIKVGLRL